MICTVTLNPSLDYVLHAKGLESGKINRSEREEILPGGKGINVSRVLAEFGIQSTAFGFAGGFTGKELIRLVRACGVNADFLPVCGDTRINVKIRAAQETDVNAGGPSVTQADLSALAEKLRTLPPQTMLVFAGSAPSSLSPDCYVQLLSQCDRKDFRIALDASGELLRRSLALNPWLIKPNLEELEGLVGEKLTSRAEAVHAANRVREKGVQNVLVSLGGEGALFVSDRGEQLYCPAPQGRVVDTVGAGDSMLAGFIAAKEQGVTDKDALETGIAAGSATAFRVGLAQRGEILALRRRVHAAE